MRERDQHRVRVQEGWLASNLNHKGLKSYLEKKDSREEKKPETSGGDWKKLAAIFGKKV
jgi:hypothetical protein